MSHVMTNSVNRGGGNVGTVGEIGTPYNYVHVKVSKCHNSALISEGIVKSRD